MTTEVLTRRLSLLLAGLPRALLAAILAFPVVVALFQILLGLLGLRPEDILAERANPIWVLAYVMAKSDSGAQLPAGASLYQVLTSLMVVTWLLLPRRFPASIRRSLLLISAALACGWASALWSQHRAAALADWVSVLLLFLTALLTLQLHHERPLDWLPGTLKIGAGLVIFTALALEAIYGMNSDRLSGSFHHPNIFAAFLVLSLPHFWEEERPYFRYLGVGLCLLCLTLSASRGVLVALTLSFLLVYFGPAQACLAAAGWMLVFVGIHGPGWLVLAALLLVVIHSCRDSIKENAGKFVLSGLLCFSFLLALSASAENRWVKGVGSASFEARWSFWSAAVSMSWEKFPLGLGGGAFRRFFPQYQSDSAYFSKFGHSLPLSWAAEWGWLFLVLLLGAGVLAWPRSSSGIAARRKPWACACLAFLIHACVDVHVQFPALMGWFAVSVGALWCPEPDREPERPEPAEEPVERSPWSVRPRLLIQYATLPLGALFLIYYLLGVYASHYAAVAQLAARLNKPAEARDLFLEAVRLNPWESDYHRQAAQVMIANPEGIPEEVLQNAHRAVALDPARAVSHNVLGRLLEGAGKDGRESLNRALELDPVNYPSFYTHLAEAHLSRRQVEEGLTVARRGWEHFPLILVTRVQEVRVPELSQQLAELGLVYGYLLLEQQGALAEAERALRTSLFLKSDMREAALALGLVMHRSGREEAALKMLRALVEEHPDWAPPKQILQGIAGQGSEGRR